MTDDVGLASTQTVTARRRGRTARRTPPSKCDKAPENVRRTRTGDRRHADTQTEIFPREWPILGDVWCPWKSGRFPGLTRGMVKLARYRSRSALCCDALLFVFTTRSPARTQHEHIAVLVSSVFTAECIAGYVIFLFFLCPPPPY